MTQQEKTRIDVFEGSTADREAAIARFEEAWQRQERPVIDNYLTGEGADREALLIELVHVDLECRLKAGEAVRVEEYLDRYPQLSGDDDTLVGLVGAEFQLRRRLEPDLAENEIVNRFPTVRERILEQLHAGTSSYDETRFSTVEQVAGQTDTHAGTGVRSAPVESSDQAIEIEQLGDYRLVRKLGKGGMGTVYEAEHMHLGKRFAVKVLARRWTDDPTVLARFRQERKAVGQLDHPNIVQATDAGQVDQRHYLVTELIDGCDLHAVVSRLGPVAIADACEMVRQAALGLQHVHQNSLVHRDVKPSNLMLTRQGQVKLLDLGLARLHQRPDADGVVTVTGELMGTFDYMAPEQTGDPR